MKLLAAAVVIVFIPAVSMAAVSLEKGIAHYRSGDYDAALDSFQELIDGRTHTALAHYYSARIQYEKGRYTRARSSLGYALKDSASFADAMGLLACVDLKLGDTTAALAGWNRFLAALGRSARHEPVTLDSIMLPEEYRAQSRRTSTASAVDDSARYGSGTVFFGKYREARPVVSLVMRRLAKKPVEQVYDHHLMGIMINLLLGMVALFTVYAFVKYARPVTDEEDPDEPMGRKWTPPPDQATATDGGMIGGRDRHKVVHGTKISGERPEDKPAAIESLRDMRNRHAVEIDRLLKRL